jgi:hypothetical protein
MKKRRSGTVTLYGYRAASKSDTRMHLKEVTVMANPDVIRRLADALASVARRMEEAGDDFGFEHLSDVDDRLPETPRVVVVRPS